MFIYFAHILQPSIGFSYHFFLLKTNIHMQILNTKPFLYNFRGLRNLQNKIGFLIVAKTEIIWFRGPIYFENYEDRNSFDIYAVSLCYLAHKVPLGGLQGPSWASWRIFAQILRFWGQYETAWICNDLFWNRILFCKYPGPLRSHRNGVVFKIYVWILVFRRKNGVWK